MSEILTKVIPALESNVLDPPLGADHTDDRLFGRSRVYWQEDLVWLQGCRYRLSLDLERSETWLERLDLIIDLLNYTLHGPHQHCTAEHARNALGVLREGIFHWLIPTRGMDSFIMLSAYEELAADDRLERIVYQLVYTLEEALDAPQLGEERVVWVQQPVNSSGAG